jgi:hypothetical protein
LRTLVRKLLQILLQEKIERKTMLAAIGLKQHHLIGRMGCQHRQSFAFVRNRLGFCPCDFVAWHESRQRRPVEDAIARGTRRSREAIRPAQFGRLRQGY